MISFSDNYDSHLICLMCVNQYNLLESDLLLIDDVLNSTQDTIFKNFPPLGNKCLQEKMNKLSEDILIIDAIQEKIQTNLENFKTNLNGVILEMENRSYLQLNHLLELKKNMIDTYRQISSSQQLKEFLQKDQEDKYDQIKGLLEDKKANKIDNAKKIGDYVLQLDSLIQSFTLEVPNQIQSTIYNLIKQIDYFSNAQCKSLDNELIQDESECINQNNQLKQQVSHHKIMQDLISNKTNYCSEEYLSYINKQLDTYQYLFNNQKQDINCIQDKQKSNSFILLNDQQLESIRNLSQSIQDIQQKYDSIMSDSNSNEIVESIQPNSYKVMQSFMNKYHYNHLESQFSKLLRSYPVFEMVFIPREKCILGETELIKSQQEHSQKMEIARIEKQQICITATSYKYAQSYTNFILNPESKYIFRINVQSYINSYEQFILFGLIADQDKDSKLLHGDMLSYCERGNEFGMNKIIKGGPVHLNSRLHRNRTFEVRIHLKEKVYKIADYPNFERVCEINDKSRLLENVQYRFATELCYKDDKIVIQDILEVEQFDDHM